MAAISPATLPAAAVSNSCLRATMRKAGAITYIEGMNSYGGLKAQNAVSSLEASRCADESFSLVMNSIKSSSQGMMQGKSRGGALSSTCSAVAEIFKIAAIMNGLVLVGVAVGFVLLRLEASVEEAE